jgi:hypothetical protein
MAGLDTSVLEQFKWEPQEQAGAWLRAQTDVVLSKNGWARQFAAKLLDQAGVRFMDQIGLIIMPDNAENRRVLVNVGYVPTTVDSQGPAFHHPDGMFPRVMLAPSQETDIGLKVERVADFALANKLTETPSGKPGDLTRYIKASSESGINVYGLELHGMMGVEKHVPNVPIDLQAQVFEAFVLRTRDPAPGLEAAVFDDALRIVTDAVGKVGRDVACDLFFKAEREYWMRRNRAAQVQYARQDKLGIGWANHDHHTYRSSREMFPKLVAVWEKLGLVCRERFYAGLEAGWGAQVMEQPVTGIITFNDVDMSPEELMGDFSHEGFKEKRDKLGTIGLWCGLHGEAFLQAGMHHLEAQFDHHRLTRQLEEEHGIKTMKPFTSFQYLTQAFTEGERWMIDVRRLDRLLSMKLIDREQHEQFRQYGAIGSHLENLERNDGFKGFNQKGVSEIIAATDPRKLTAALAGAH